MRYQTDEELWEAIDRQYEDRLAAFFEAVDNQNNWIVTSEIGSGHWLMQCKACGFVYQYGRWSDVNLLYKCDCKDDIPFNGELDPEDAPENTPDCYGVGRHGC